MCCSIAIALTGCVGDPPSHDATLDGDPYTVASHARAYVQATLDVPMNGVDVDADDYVISRYELVPRNRWRFWDSNRREVVITLRTNPAMNAAGPIEGRSFAKLSVQRRVRWSRAEDDDDWVRENAEEDDRKQPVYVCLKNYLIAHDLNAPPIAQPFPEARDEKAPH